MSVENLANGEQMHQEAVAAHQAATDKLQALAARLTEARAKMTTISQARINGTASAQDAAEYSALAGDVALLEKMEAEALAATKLTNDQVHGAFIWYTDASRAHEQELMTAKFEAMKAKTAEIEAVFTRAIGMTAKLGKTLGHHSLSQSYQPGQTLHRALNLGVAPPVEE